MSYEPDPRQQEAVAASIDNLLKEALNEATLATAGPSNADVYERGDLVEVLNAQTGAWTAATVTRFWRGITGSGEPANQIDADGVDADGPFYGRFDCDHARRRLQ